MSNQERTQLRLNRIWLEVGAQWARSVMTPAQIFTPKSLNMAVDSVLMQSCRKDSSTNRAFMAFVEICQGSKDGQIWHVHPLSVKTQTTKSLSLKTLRRYSIIRETISLKMTKEKHLSMCLHVLRLNEIRSIRDLSFTKTTKIRCYREMP